MILKIDLDNVKPYDAGFKELASIFHSAHPYLDSFLKEDRALDPSFGKTYVWLTEENSAIIGYATTERLFACLTCCCKSASTALKAYGKSMWASLLSHYAPQIWATIYINGRVSLIWKKT